MERKNAHYRVDKIQSHVPQPAKSNPRFQAYFWNIHFNP
jgi:hypothetical protein